MEEQGDRIGMLLDLDQGSMTVWKNDEKLGMMAAKGLRGPLSWAVELGAGGPSVRIESAPARPSPTGEELAAAKAYESSVRATTMMREFNKACLSVHDS